MQPFHEFLPEVISAGFFFNRRTSRVGELRSTQTVLDYYCAVRGILETIERVNKLPRDAALNVLKTAAETIGRLRGGYGRNDASEALRIFSRSFLLRAASFLSPFNARITGFYLPRRCAPRVSPYRAYLITATCPSMQANMTFDFSRLSHFLLLARMRVETR